MSVINSIPLIAAGDDGYQISRSVRLRSSASAYFNRTPASAGNQQKWTWSGWVKRGSFGQQQLFGAGAGTGGSPECYIDFEDNLNFQIFDGTSNLAVVRSTAVYRDPSAWYHVVVAVDTTQATAANRVLLYINGQQITSFAFSTYPTQNLNTQVNATTAHRISSSTRVSAYYFDGYLTETNFIDGQQLTPSSFGETDAVTGVWKPKRYTGTYGTNGFYLNFSDNSNNTATTIGKDSSGNGNNWTPNNISITSGSTYDSMLDVPTPYADGGNGRGNYAVGNPLNADGATWSGGNLNFSLPNSTNNAQGTIAVTTGKWYWEVVYSANPTQTGVQESGLRTRWTSGVVYSSDGNKYINGTATAYGATYTTGDVIGVALDMDGSTVTFYKNNTSQGSISLSGSGVINATLSLAAGGGVASVGSVNFGQRPFAYTPPTGFKTLNTQNLPESTIKKGNAYFDATTYTGNGSTQSIVNAGGMQPDFVWIKSRSSGTQSHELFDSVRGISKPLNSSNTNAEVTYSGNSLTAFNSNGFTVVDDATGNYWVNGSTGSPTYVGWQWKESASAGFDIVTYTGNGTSQNISHSLGVAPKMMIIKNRGGTVNWGIYHASLGSGSPQNYVMQFDTAGQYGPSSTYWNGTAPTSSVFSVGSLGNVNGSGGNFVAYLFAEVAGFSKFGSYTGNGSTDGPFVYCGFRPRWIMFKATGEAGSWTIIDTARLGYNANNSTLYADLSSAEQGYLPADILSNGFKIRLTSTGTSFNTSGIGYIYAAFAENPFKNSLAR